MSHETEQLNEVAQLREEVALLQREVKHILRVIGQEDDPPDFPHSKYLSPYRNKSRAARVTFRSVDIFNRYLCARRRSNPISFSLEHGDKDTLESAGPVVIVKTIQRHGRRTMSCRNDELA